MNKPFKVKLGSIEAVPMGQGLSFSVEGEEIAIFRSRAGEVSAIENKCPHANGPLAEGIIGEGKVVCPLHGHQFDLSTGKGCDRNESVRSFPAWIENGELYIDYSTTSPELVVL